MRWHLFPYLLALSLLLSACTTMVPRENLPYPLTSAEFDEQVKVVTIPLPALASNPNEGITAGALAAFLLHDRKDEVNSLLAPQINYNQYYGTTFSVYGAFYPSPQQTMEVNLSQSTKVNNDYEFRYIDHEFLASKFDVNLFLYSWNDGSARFFGFQSDSNKDDETNYDDQENGFTLSVGYPIGKHFQVIFGERFRKVNIRPGAVKSLPFIGNFYTSTEVPGVTGFSAHAQKIALVYSTLDSTTTPTFGGYARAAAEISAKILGSSADYRHYELEMKGFIPFDDARYITAFRLAYNQTLGNSVPFLERSILGGETTLRGYGRNRFIDHSYLLFNLEERIRLFRWEIFNVTADWEVAPFIDFGSVMKALDRADTDSFEFNPGIGIRAIVRPNIIGRIDVGFGKEGPAVYVGLGYPF
jgi:outer membrane protein assembly factor BamA